MLSEAADRRQGANNDERGDADWLWAPTLRVMRDDRVLLFYRPNRVVNHRFRRNRAAGRDVSKGLLASPKPTFRAETLHGPDRPLQEHTVNYIGFSRRRGALSMPRTSCSVLIEFLRPDPLLVIPAKAGMTRRGRQRMMGRTSESG